MKSRFRLVYLLILFLLAVSLFFAVLSPLANANDIPTDPTMAHVWADAVAWPLLQATINEFYRLHPADKNTAYDHARMLDAKKSDSDHDRGVAAREAAEAWAKAMKRAGY
jgi:hypothetical protein